MKKSVLMALMAVVAMAASAGNSPYIARVYDFMPAPGQFVNVFPAYKPGYTQDSINAQLETALCGKLGGSVSLGSYGGYIVFGFDHPVVNKHGYDVKIYGNAMQSAAVADMAGGSCEPGIIMVGVDMDGDGVPSDGDKWYEIKGNDYDRCQPSFEVTYYKPDEDKERVPHASWRFISDVEYVRWTSNDVNPDSTSGYVWRNTFHTQPYWPLWIEDTVLTFRGTKLPNTSIDMSNGNGNSWFQPFFSEGYVDNLPNGQEPGFKIDWAIDEEGRPANLDHIDFIKVYSGQLDYCGWLGEVSTEVCGAEDLHPDAEGDEPGPGPDDFTFTNGIIFINEDRYGPNQGSINYYNYDYDEMEYNVYAFVNPDTKLGVTTQYGQLFGDKLFVVSKQANGNEASGSTVGSRLAVLDAATLKQQGSILRFGESPDSVYDGRAYCGVTADKGYVSTSAGIFVIDVPTMSVTGAIDGTLSSAKGDYNSLYRDQCGDMVRFGQYVFAVQQGKGLHVIDPATDAVVTTLPFPNIATVFVTAGGHLYVANNSREIYDYSGGPYEANFTRIDPVTLEVKDVHDLGDMHGAMSSWGAWRACAVCADPVNERVYYNYDEFQNYISCYDFESRQFIDRFIDLPEAAEVNWDGTRNHQGLYASALSFDPHTGDLVVQTLEAAPMYAYQIFNHNWVLFYDADTRELKRQVRLQDAYWFPAMAVYPDVSDPTVILADTQLARGETYIVDMMGAVGDRDNMSALAVTTAHSANPQIARVWMSGVDLHIEAMSPGQTTVDVTVDSNGRMVTTTFTVVVTQSVKGDVNNDTRVNINDVTDLINYLLSGDADGVNLWAADVDSSGIINIADVTSLINFLLSGNY